VPLFEDRAALEDHAAQRQAEIDAAGSGLAVTVGGAFWPPRVG